MNIGIFTNNYRPRLSGVAISIDTFCDEFQRQGHQVYIFAPSYPNYNENSKNVFRLKSIPAIYDNTLALPIPYSGKIAGMIPDLELDIIHTQHPFVLGQFGARLARKHKIPLVFTYHTLYEEYAHYIPFNENIVRKMAVILSTAYANKCNLVVVPSEGVKELLRMNGVKTRMENVPTGINLSKYDGLDPQVIRREYNIPPEAKILLYVGRLAKEKNLAFLIEAFKVILEGIPQALLVMVGDGPLRGKLKRLAKRLGINKHIIFTGTKPRNEIYVYHLAADLFIFASLTETQGLVLYETLAAGTPVVAVEAISTSEVITNGVNGYLVREHPAEFGEKAVNLLLDVEKCQEFSLKAKEMSKGVSSHTQALKMLSLYEELRSQS